MTRIGLPASVLTGVTVRELLELILEKYRWFRPARCGFATLDTPLDPEHLDYGRLVAIYEELRALTVAGPTDKDFLLLVSAKAPDSPFAGTLTWMTSASVAAQQT
ncbi:hypothetical protein [Hyalangium rubrum]|uniref:Uncharacterized protein n=1 Tax=Hyalangium rubrum TaxID=3103134 RepID=A0ABU5HCS4_9BACT|nr:hypothetical protein [Hyalangium sp. s54d21]MDY7230622.1 hypothetical protein [Hyalangium sp. s54d21]